MNFVVRSIMETEYYLQKLSSGANDKITSKHSLNKFSQLSAESTDFCQHLRAKKLEIL